MSHLPRAFWSLKEAAIRLNVTIPHVVGFALRGELPIKVGIAYAECSDTQMAGLVQINAADILPLFCGDQPKAQVHVRRLNIMTEGDSWQFITQPEDGLAIRASDLLIMDEDLERFEAANNLNGKRFVTNPTGQARYDWEAFYAAVAAHLYESGIPESQNKLAEAMQQWFIDRDPNAEAPDLRTIRRRIKPVWDAISKADAD